MTLFYGTRVAIRIRKSHINGNSPESIKSPHIYPDSPFFSRHSFKEKGILNFYTAILIALLTTIISNDAISSPVCSREDIEEALLAFGLDDDISTNGEIMGELENKYGTSLVEYLAEKHPLLENAPDTPFDGNTLKWIQEAIWSTNHKYVRNQLLPIVDFNEKAWDYMMGHLFQEFKEKKIRYRYIFTNDKTKDMFHIFVADDEKMKAFILKSYPDATPEAVNSLLAEFRKYFITNKNYSVGFSSLAGQKAPVIQIMGHGKPNFPGISMGDATVSVDEMVDLVKSLNIPKDATIKMNVCFSGCKDYAMGYPVASLKEMFLDGNLKDLYDAESKSLLDLFAESLFGKMPEFEGKVQGYLGTVLSEKRPDALNIHGMEINAHAVRVKGINGYIYFKQGDARLTIVRADYAPKF